jgi:hypothetical protein
VTPQDETTSGATGGGVNIPGSDLIQDNTEPKSGSIKLCANAYAPSCLTPKNKNKNGERIYFTGKVKLLDPGDVATYSTIYVYLYYDGLRIGDGEFDLFRKVRSFNIWFNINSKPDIEADKFSIRVGGGSTKNGKRVPFAFDVDKLPELSECYTCERDGLSSKAGCPDAMVGNGKFRCPGVEILTIPKYYISSYYPTSQVLYRCYNCSYVSKSTYNCGRFNTDFITPYDVASLGESSTIGEEGQTNCEL